VNPELSRKILSSGEDLSVKGERRECALLFARLLGLQVQETRLPPDKWMSDLNECLTLFSASVFDRQGTLDRFGSGSLRAVWGAPVPLEDMEGCALHCAFDMREKLEKLNQTRLVRGEKPLSVGIGMHSGFVVAGYLGSDRQADYTVIGMEADKAERLALRAAPGQILISEYLYGSLSGRITVKRIESLPTDQLPDLGALYEVIAWVP